MMSEFEGAEVLSSTAVAFADPHAGMEPFFRLVHWRVKVGDREDDRIIWKRGDFVLIVPVDRDGNIILIREFKQAVQRTLLCVPAGGVKKGETPIAAALRELKEETGFIAEEEDCVVFGPFYNSPDKSTERHFVVLVTDAESNGPAVPEESETILGVQLSPLGSTKHKLPVGLHYMAVDVVEAYLDGKTESVPAIQRAV